MLLLKKFSCSQCKKHSSICTCIFPNYQGKQLYYIVDNPTAKGKNVSELNFYNYLDSFLYEWKCETRVKISQERKKLFFSYKKYKSISSFDDSNFSQECGVHNKPFSYLNKISNNKCLEQSCKFSFKYMMYLHENLETLKKNLFFFENGKLKSWLPPSSPLNLPPPLSTSPSNNSSSTTQIAFTSNPTSC